MKKITILCVLIMFAMASSAFAATGAWTATAGQTMYALTTTGTPTAATGTSIGKLSSNVVAGGFLVAAGSGYAISTRHNSGSQSYGSAHDSTSIYMIKSESLAAMSQTGTGDFITGGWTAL